MTDEQSSISTYCNMIFTTLCIVYNINVKYATKFKVKCSKYFMLPLSSRHRIIIKYLGRLRHFIHRHRI